MTLQTRFLLQTAVLVLLAVSAGHAQQKTTPNVIMPDTTTAVTTTGGQTGTVAAFNGASSIVTPTSGILYTNLTSGGLGIGRGPAAALDVLGQTIFRGGAIFSRSGEATTSAGKPSFQFQFQSSVWNSSNKGTLIPNFTLQSEPTGNNTASTGATLNFLYYSGVGSAPAETGLYINPTGVIHFAPSQTFPITQGPAGPQGATGPAGPAGPKGATGATGPAGSLSLPYSAQGSNAASALFNLYNNASDGIGIQGAGGLAAGTAGPVSGAGVVGYGGPSPNVEYGEAGTGVYGDGGASAGNPYAATSAGTGVIGQGGNAAVSTDQGGYGGIFIGGHNSYGVLGESPADGTGGAGLFIGEVTIDGNVSKYGGSFKIDDPADPSNKYLYHSFVESPDMMNIYNGNAVTDGSGTAVVTMPSYFEALNTDFRYQLTVMGQFAQAIVGSEIENGVFTIKTDKPGVKVSWQVTGVRQDAWANAHRIPNEVDKAEKDKGHYLSPELFGHADDLSIARHNSLRPTVKH